MQLKNYSPLFRNILFRKSRPEKTSSGLYIPSIDFKMKTFSDTFENEKEHKSTDELVDLIVVKVGRECSSVKPGDKLKLMLGARPELIIFDDEELWNIMEMQIIGYERGESN